MSDDSTSTSCSRRGFLNGGAAFVAGGLIGSAAGLVSSAAAQPSRETAELPWPWAKIDPMEAGRRSFHNYHEKGG
jgi:anaerobic selenocysteine-containing dehydrogenase